jgi:hypothetical protein
MNHLPANLGALSLQGGIHLLSDSATQTQAMHNAMRTLLVELGLHTRLPNSVALVENTRNGGHILACGLHPTWMQAHMPAHDTLALHTTLAQPEGREDEQQGEQQDEQQDKHTALDREILVALLAAPQPFTFASVTALRSHIRVRRWMALAAGKTTLAFKTAAAERPEDFWHYEDAHGFVLNPGSPLIDALIAATQPEISGRLYDFSCYRATEYVILLGIAQELRMHHPALLAALQTLNETYAIRSGKFHDVFLIEYGSMQQPLPARYYVPGDRLWFRNPDARSADVTGYEGSWVIYMGGGLFSNFWERNHPFTLESKAVEIYHWKDGVVTDTQGELQMDEARVAQHVAHTCAQPDRYQAVLARMLRWRDPQGIYAQGGCIDTTREYPRGVSADHCELVLPAASKLA